MILITVKRIPNSGRARELLIILFLLENLRNVMTSMCGAGTSTRSFLK